ncbi:MAG TPA: hypothetical protein VHX61_18495 [Rhizomicrobium sp.]|nr:hypothetical protein [Rhizomicrobium sp.]
MPAAEEPGFGSQRSLEVTPAFLPLTDVDATFLVIRLGNIFGLLAGSLRIDVAILIL